MSHSPEFGWLDCLFSKCICSSSLNYKLKDLFVEGDKNKAEVKQFDLLNIIEVWSECRV